VHRPPGNIIDEVKKLARAGSKEVTLLGQTINHYAYRHGDGRTTTFADLLYQVHEAAPDLPRLRFVTSFPRDFTNDALAAMRACDRICGFLLAPDRNGCDRVVKRMNRGYSAQQYIDFVDRARQYMPDVSIASDFIVGFPSETDEEFAQTVELVKRCRFKNSFIFKYSPRPGTVAIDRFDDDVPEDVKRRRNNELLAVQQKVTAAENAKLVGKTLEVMVEGESKLVGRRTSYPSSKVELGWERSQSPAIATARSSTQLVGRTRGDQVVFFEGDLSLKGRHLDVEITDYRGMTLFARLVDSAATVAAAR
jgi:tRNA-2-methylthio-N6-dimethylallyladenosine synthase